MEAKITETNKAIAETAELVLKLKLRGELLFPNSQGYDKARTLWNIMIDRHPLFSTLKRSQIVSI